MNSFFKNKVVWITGASSGIGEALVQELSLLGAKIVLSARRESELERVRLENNLDDSNSLLLPLNLEHYNNFNALPNIVIKKFGTIDVLINNGGTSQRSLAHETSFEVYESLMKINYFGNIALTLAVLPFLRDNKKGWLVSISSVAGKIGVPLRTGYSATKAALTGFYEALRAENDKQGIKVTLVYPGFIKTRISDNALKGDGTKQNSSDNAILAGIHPNVCARKILRAISDEKLEVIIAGRKERMGVLWHKFFPTSFARVIASVKVT